MTEKPFAVMPPRQWHRLNDIVSIETMGDGWVLLGGIFYLNEGKQAQAAAYFPDNATEQEIDIRKQEFLELEEKHGIDVKF